MKALLAEHRLAAAAGTHPDSGPELGRIAYVVRTYPKFSETFIVNEILAHEAAGLDIEIFSMEPPTEGRFQDSLSRVKAPVTYLPNLDISVSDFWYLLHEAAREFPNLWEEVSAHEASKARHVLQAISLARAIRTRGISHLHAHFATVAALVARLAGHLAGVPYTITAHAKDIYHEGVDEDALGSFLHDAAGLITVSRYNLAHLRDRFGESATRRTTVVYNGLDLDRFAFRRPGPAGGARKVVSIGRLVEKKGFADLVVACALLRDAGRPVQCDIVGDGKLEAELHEQIAGLGLESLVRLRGALPQQQVIELVREAGVLAAPCVVGNDGNRDGLPTVLIEAMALGTPVVATPVTGIPELVHHRETGFLVPEHDPRALAGAIDELLGDGRLAAQIALSARQMVEDHFDARGTSAQVRDCFAAAQFVRAS